MAEYNLGRVKGAMWYVGNAASDTAITEELTGAGRKPLEFDCYLNLTTGDVYQYMKSTSALEWKKQGSIKGPTGAAGANGTNGKDGAAGKDGATGAAAGFGTPSATAKVLDAGASPTAKVTATGEDTEKVFSFEFGIPKGQDGKNGTNGQDGAPGAAAGFGTPKASATVLEAGATPTAEVTATGDDTGKIFTFKFGIPKGQNGTNGTNGKDGAAGKDGKTPTLSINEAGELIATFAD